MVEIFDKDSARAIEETSKTVGKGIDLAQVFGHWFSEYCGHPIKQGLGLWGDKLYYRRVDNLINFRGRTKEKINELGLKNRLQPADMKMVVPLLEAVSMEEDDYLRELWANLLVNSLDGQRNNRPHPAFVGILQNLIPEEAKLLHEIASRREGRGIHTTTTSASNQMRINEFLREFKKELAEKSGLPELSEKDILALLDNLLRLELIREEGEISTGELGPGVETYTIKMYLSPFGEKFMDAVTL